MQKIIVIGCPGSGKSTFSKELHKVYNIPLYHLDLIWNKPDKTTITRDEFNEELVKIFSTDDWIIDGNYQRTIEARIKEANTIFLLDYPLEVCLEGANSRVGVNRDDLPWLEETLDKKFEQKIIDFSKEKLPVIYELLNKYKDNKNIIVFKARKEATEYLNAINKKVINNIRNEFKIYDIIHK